MNINVPRIFNIVALILLLAGAFSPDWIVYKNTDTGRIVPLNQLLGGIGNGTIHSGLYYTLSYDVTDTSLLVYTLLLLQTGAFTPSWVIFKNIEGLTIHIIIYIVGLCTSQTPPSITYLEFQIEVIIGIVCCAVATIFTLVYQTGPGGHSFLVLAALFNLISGIFTWIAVGRFLYSYLWVYSEFNNGVPYSLILTGFDGVLCFIIVIILLFVKKQQDRNLAAPCSSSELAFTNAGEPQVYLAYGRTAF